MKRFTQQTTLMGTVIDGQTEEAVFRIKCRSGDEILVSVGKETRFEFMRNLDGVNYDRVPNPEGFAGNSSQLVNKYQKC